MNRIGQNTNLASDAVLGQRVTLGNNVTVYPDVSIGDDCFIFDGAVLGRPPMSTGNTTRPLPASRPLTIGDGCIIGANAVLYSGISMGPRVLIGDLATIREGCRFAEQVVVGRGVLVMYDTFIGARTRVVDGTVLTGNMTVEEDVFFGPGVHSTNDNGVYLRRFGLSPFEVRGPLVRRFALVGTGANLAAGVEIGMGAIVAPGAVVTHDVQDWTVVAGVPARVVKSVSPADRDQILLHFGVLQSPSREAA